MFKRNLKVLLSVLVFWAVAPAVGAPPKYPVISEWQGPVWVTGKDGKREALKAKTFLREKAHIETGPGGFAKITLDDVRTVSLLSGTTISFPAISWEGGEAPVLIFKTGDIFWEQEIGKKGAYNTAIRSDLFEFIAPAGDYVLSMNPTKAYASAKVLEGTLVFSAMNAEESIKLQKGQQVGFQGVLEEGEIAYDILLKGKKIPKGHLLAVQPVDVSELNKRAEAEQKMKAEKASQEKKHKAAAEKFKKEGYICASPSAKFNQCAWVCLNNPKKAKKDCLTRETGVVCQRQRCNANGQWAEMTPLDAEKGSTVCQAKPVVAACDY